MATTKGRSKEKGLSGQALKEFRHSVSVLKKKGIVSKRVDARSQIDTRYMRAKVRAFNDVIEGRAVVLRAPKETVRKYRVSGALPTSNGRIVVPKNHPLQKTSIDKRGFVTTVTPLKNGTSETVTLPIEPQNLRSFVKQLIAEKDEVDGLKEADEYFSFRVGENNSQRVFADAEEMASYLTEYYMREENPITTKKQVRQLFTFQRFKMAPGWEGQKNPFESGKPKLSYPKSDATGRNHQKRDQFYRDQEAARKRRQRAKETPSERKARLASNARRTARYKQRIFEGDY